MIWRGAIAVVLTGISSALAVSLGTIFIEWLATGRVAFELFFFFWFFGSLVATVFALAVGGFVEWPKAARAAQTKRAGRLLAQVGVSAIAGILLLMLMGVIELALQAAGGSIGPDLIESLLAYVILGATGGVCSALAWFLVVIRPMLRADRDSAAG